DGVTIRGGNANGTGSNNEGGGVFAAQTGLGGIKLRNCLLTKNAASLGGGLATAGSAAVRLEDCQFIGNAATDDGGGLYLVSSGTQVIHDCVLSGNSAVDGGGGIAQSGGTVSVNNSQFIRNTADRGAGIFDSTGNLRVFNCALQGGI